ncbi:MAG: hypothetical protein JJD97_00860, partial [Gemmatimonadaceae bacterium]|nr:hypothetical protein [Gemmatimonadaceae bacterium]
MTATWMRRRASNVYGRPLFLAKVGGVAFALALLSFLLLARATAPAADRGAQREMLEDTVVLRASERRVAARLRDAESALASAREKATQMRSDAISPEAQVRRDSLAAAAAELTRLLGRSDDAPLVASFRALGASAPMSGAPRVAQLLDSLNDVDKARSDFGSSDGVDPIFVALTARVGAIGHEIEAAARLRRAALRRAIDSLTPPPVAGATID